jgi:pSer/pThr/pTyr-binding forkhead associated (FHA) protein
MDFEIGIVCGRCDRFSPMGTVTCACGHDLSLFAPPTVSTRPSAEIRSPMLDETPALPGVAPVPTGPSAGFAPPGVSVQTTPRSPASPASAPRSPPKPSVEVIPSTRSSPVGLASPYAHLSQEELMEQARNYVCLSCHAGVPVGHKFCGRCGAAVPPEILNARTLFFSDMQNPAKAKLVLIRGEGMEGLSYHLRAEEHIAGRAGNLQFPDDPFISPKHANFFYRNNKLVVRDEGSRNGVYIRIRGTVDIAIGDVFLAGEQVFRIDPHSVSNDPPLDDGTYFYSSPKYAGPFRIVQIFQGGCPGMVVCARTSSLQIGREGGDLNFPGDPYMSGTHCRIEEVGGRLTLTDLNSRNGTYVRVKDERELQHGDYLFIGRKLLRVELNTN